MAAVFCSTGKNTIEQLAKRHAVSICEVGQRMLGPSFVDDHILNLWGQKRIQMALARWQDKEHVVACLLTQENEPAQIDVICHLAASITRTANPELSQFRMIAVMMREVYQCVDEKKLDLNFLGGVAAVAVKLIEIVTHKTSTASIIDVLFKMWAHSPFPPSCSVACQFQASSAIGQPIGHTQDINLGSHHTTTTIVKRSDPSGVDTTTTTTIVDRRNAASEAQSEIVCTKEAPIGISIRALTTGWK